MKLPTECPFGEGMKPTYVRMTKDVPSKYGGNILPEGAVTVVFDYDERALPTPGFVCAYTDPWHSFEWASVLTTTYEVITKEEAILALLEQDGFLTVLG